MTITPSILLVICPVNAATGGMSQNTIITLLCFSNKFHSQFSFMSLVGRPIAKILRAVPACQEYNHDPEHDLDELLRNKFLEASA